jgi:hypothetical protein
MIPIIRQLGFRIGRWKLTTPQSLIEPVGYLAKYVTTYTSGNRRLAVVVAVFIRHVEGIVADVGIKIESLGIAYVGVGNGIEIIGPIGRHEAAEGGGVETSTEVVQAGFGVAFFAGEFVGERRVLEWAVVQAGQRVVGLDETGAAPGARNFSGISCQSKDTILYGPEPYPPPGSSK